MIRFVLLLAIAAAVLIIAPRAGYSSKVILKPGRLDTTNSKGWREEIREGSETEERRERREDRRDERQERREDIVDEIFE